MDPGEILREDRRTRAPERFDNLKIGMAWVDAENRVDKYTVLGLCGSEGMLERSEGACTMGVDTGRELHVVISRFIKGEKKRRMVYLGVHQSFEELDGLMERFNVRVCVIDGLPETHPTRAFARRHHGKVFMNFFVEAQKGATKWDYRQHIVQENRTEALDASRRALREGLVILPRQTRIVEEFAAHCASDAKQLHEDEETGAQVFRYVRTGTNHFSLAFTYDVLAWERDSYARQPIIEVVTRGDLDGRWIPLGDFMGWS